MNTILFAIGRNRGPNDATFRALSGVARTLGFTTVALDLDAITDPDTRAERLSEHAASLPRSPILVGSGMDGYACLMASQHVHVRALFLLAPAIGLPGYPTPNPAPPACPVEIAHGWCDEVVPAATVIDWARHARARLHMADDDHDLSGNLPWLAETFASQLKRVLALTA